MRSFNVGWIGLGKLGLPCALGCEAKGHTVFGFDINPKVEEILRTKKIPYMEEGAQLLLEKSNIKLLSLSEVVRQADIVFVAIQTPHDPKYEGINKLPKERIDFDYSLQAMGFR